LVLRVSRTLVSLRSAQPADAEPLAELWATSLRRAEHCEQVADLEQLIKEVATSSERRLVVAEYDGAFAGAVLLQLGTISPLNGEPVVQAHSPHVLPQFRRHGIGALLMESAVSFAEENGVSLVAAAASSGSREANRFMARLSLGPNAVLRLAPTVAVRAKLEAQRPTLTVAAGTPGGTRQLTRVLAARRSMRRAAGATKVTG
jgi:ribosomal protein S18 acetylase RimI-like enzyme